MSDLKGTRICVAGGTGDVGAGIVEALLDAGAQVFVPVRDPAKGARLLSGLAGRSGVTLVPGDLGAPDGADLIAEEIGRSGPLDAAVASLGGWWQGPGLIDVAETDWHDVLASNLTSHFRVARALVPRMVGKGGSYVQILGAAAEHPVPGSSLISITAAAAAMMGRAMAAELKKTPVTIRQLMIASIVATRARASADPSWVTAREVGEKVAEMIADPGGAQLMRLAARQA